jgi:hypothetical protein
VPLSLDSTSHITVAGTETNGIANSDVCVYLSLGNKIVLYQPSTNYLQDIFSPVGGNAEGVTASSIALDFVYAASKSKSGSNANVTLYSSGGSVVTVIPIYVQSSSVPALGDIVANIGMSKLYVSIPGDNRIAVINLNASNSVTYYDIGGKPSRMIVSARTHDVDRYVTFTAKTAYDTVSVSGLTVSVYDASGRVMYTDTTDSSGKVTFILSTLQHYQVVFNQSPNVNVQYDVSPGQTSEYIVRIPFTDLIGLTRWSDVIRPDTASASTRYLLATDFDTGTGHAWMNATLTDTSGGTTSAMFYLYKNGSGLGSSDVLLSSQLDSAAPYAASFSIDGAAGNSYQIVIQANHAEGYYNYSTGLGKTFPGAKWLAGILPQPYYFFLVLGMVLICFSVGTLTKKGLWGIFGSVVGAIFAAGGSGWWSLYLSDEAALTLCGLVFIFSFIMYLTEREKYT